MTTEKKVTLIVKHKFWAMLLIFTAALIVRGLTGYFIGNHLDDAGYFPFGIYNIFDARARAILDGTEPAFWVSDPSQTNAIIYPPGYSLWLALIYGVTGIRSPHVVQVIQLVIDSASVLLITAIAAIAFEWRVGLFSGILAAFSPLLAGYGASPLADAPTSWFILGGSWMLLKAARQESLTWALGAGAMVGASCWFRANALLMAFFWAAAIFLCLRAVWSKRLAIAGATALACVVAVSPVIVRNSIASGAFVPTGLGAGTNLWEGIGETSRAAEFGAVYGDRALIEQERLEMGVPGDESVGLYWPDGVARDRARMSRALNVIASNPVWYSGVMISRMIGHLKFFGSTSPIYGSAGFNITPARCLPDSWKYFPLSTIVTLLGWCQSILRIVLLPFMMVGIAYAIWQKWRISLLMLVTVFYYLSVGMFMHSEIRYSLPMQAVLFVFAGVAFEKLLSYGGPAFRHLQTKTDADR